MVLLYSYCTMYYVDGPEETWTRMEGGCLRRAVRRVERAGVEASEKPGSLSSCLGLGAGPLLPLSEFSETKE